MTHKQVTPRHLKYISCAKPQQHFCTPEPQLRRWKTPHMYMLDGGAKFTFALQLKICFYYRLEFESSK